MRRSVTSEARKHRNSLKRRYPGLTETSLDLIVSASTEYNPDFPTPRFFKWLQEQNDKLQFDCTLIELEQIRDWYFDEGKNLRHSSRKFFSIEGIRVKVTRESGIKEWNQPIINQPEIGILGIICQNHSGILYFLMQAKIEPGNINKVQVSPTLQATKSNFTQVHGGKQPPYLKYFQSLNDKKIIVDQLQSEQGARFLKKRNRNMIIEIKPDEKIELLENYCWLTLGQLKVLLEKDNIVNMDARTVMSCTQLNLE
jgi:oxidase EvaA